jgi:hypothetical protein
MNNFNYLETLKLLDSLRNQLERIEKNLHFQIPQGLLHKYDESKDDFLNWVEEIEVLLIEYDEKINR